MKNLCKCDRCDKEGQMLTWVRLPNGWEKFDELDLCRECYLEFMKIYRKAKRELMKVK